MAILQQVPIVEQDGTRRTYMVTLRDGELPLFIHAPVATANLSFFMETAVRRYEKRTAADGSVEYVDAGSGLW